jgi:peptide/nickel transport system substrate-binding protein
VDRRRIYGTVFEGDGVAGGPVAAAAAGWTLSEQELALLPGYGEPPAELAEAKRLLAEAALPDGFEVSLVTADAMKLPLVAAVIRESLAEAGIRVTVEVAGSDLGALHDRFRKGEFALGLSLLLAGLYPDAQLHLYHHSRGLANYGKYSNPAVDAKLDQQRGTYSMQERLALVHEIQRLIATAPGPIWLGSRLQATVASKRVRSFRVAPFPTGFDAAENWWLKR